MRELGITRANMVSHSSSVWMALQPALDAPEAVHTLTLMKAARPAPHRYPAVRHRRRPSRCPALRAGDPAEAVDTFLRGVFGPGYLPALGDGLPGAFEQAVADARAFFTQELSALPQWSFTEDDAYRIPRPALIVLGTASP